MSSSTVTSLLDEIDAIIWVHLGGLISPEFVSIAKICKELQIPIIEDCAHAHGAQTEAGEIAGSIGDVGCFSFYPTKLIATGEGGMLTTANDDIATAARIYRNHGTVRNDESDGLDHGVTCIYPSQNFRMTEIAAILGKYQIKQLTDFIKVRNSIADRYRHRLKSIAGINLLPKYFGHVYWNFYIILDPGISRTRFATMLLDTYGIQTANAYDPPIHEQSLYKQFVQTDKFPIASDILKRHVSLPMYVTLSLDDVDDIADAIQHVLDRIKQES
jgi:dTDP-4-amino-4,6-dideoxygalactose transaminase